MLAELDLKEIRNRVNKRRQKILDAIWIDSKQEINKQIADLSCDEIRDLMVLFGCSVTELAGRIKAYKEKIK